MFLQKSTLFTIIFFIGVLFSPGKAIADTPLTITTFYKAYSDFKIVRTAEQTGKITEEIASWLMSAKISADLKAAIINALSFEILGKDNASLFKKQLMAKYKKERFENIREDMMTPDELFCLGYLLAMDDYFSPDPALYYLELAVKRIPDSFTYQMIYAIVKAQKVFLSDPCQAWMFVNTTIQRKDLRFLMLPDAVKMISANMYSFSKKC